MAKNPAADLSDVVVQLRITNRLLATQLKSSGSMKQNELITLLATTGATTKEIAAILDTTAATVNVALYRLKKRSQPAVKDSGESGEDA